MRELGDMPENPFLLTERLDDQKYTPLLRASMRDHYKSWIIFKKETQQDIHAMKYFSFKRGLGFTVLRHQTLPGMLLHKGLQKALSGTSEERLRLVRPSYKLSVF